MRRAATVVLVGAALVMGSLPASASAPESEEVRTFPGPGAVVPGASATLVRQPHGASFTFSTNGLAPGNAHTIWFVAFNAPEECLSPMAGVSLCGLPDLGRAATEPTAVWGAGHVVGGSGKAILGGRVAVGDTSGCDALLRVPCGAGLTDPLGAEIHLVIRTHGPAIPELVSAQIHSFNRGCEAGEPNSDPPLCKNLQFAAFNPPA